VVVSVGVVRRPTPGVVYPNNPEAAAIETENFVGYFETTNK
jgi:hypothetical protein